MPQNKNLVLFNSRIYLFLFGLFFFLPFERIPAIDFGGYTVKISYIIGLLLILFSLPKLPALFRQYQFSKSDKYLIAFWAVSLCSLYFAPDLKRSLVITAMWTFMFLLYLIVGRLLITERAKRKAEDFVIIAALVSCLFGLYQFFGDSFGLPLAWTGLRYTYSKAIFGFPRIQSVGLEPLYFGNFLLVPLFIMLERYAIEKKFVNKYWWMILLIFVNLILGIARGVYAALLVTLPLFLIFLSRQKEKKSDYRRKIVGLIAVLFVAVLISIGMILFANGRKATANFVGHAAINDTEQGESIPGRLATYKSALKLFKIKPVLGFGAGGFGEMTNRTADDIAKFGYGTVNNEYLELLVETGAVGFILFVLFLIFSIKEIYHSFQERGETEKIRLASIFLGLSAIFIQYNFFSTLYIIHIWVFMALLKAESMPFKNNEKQ